MTYKKPQFAKYEEIAKEKIAPLSKEIIEGRKKMVNEEFKAQQAGKEVEEVKVLEQKISEEYFEQLFEAFVSGYFTDRHYVRLCRRCNLLAIFKEHGRISKINGLTIFVDADGEELTHTKLMNFMNSMCGNPHSTNVTDVQKVFKASQKFNNDKLEEAIIDHFRKTSKKFEAAKDIIDYVNVKIHFNPLQRIFKIEDARIAEKYGITERNVKHGKELLKEIGAIEFFKTLGADAGFAKLWKVNPESFREIQYMSETEEKSLQKNRRIVREVLGIKVENEDEDDGYEGNNQELIAMIMHSGKVEKAD